MGTKDGEKNDTLKIDKINIFKNPNFKFHIFIVKESKFQKIQKLPTILPQIILRI